MEREALLSWQEVRKAPSAARLGRGVLGSVVQLVTRPSVVVGVGVGVVVDVALGARADCVEEKEVEGVLEGETRREREVVGVGVRVGEAEALAAVLAVDEEEGGGVEEALGPLNALFSVSPVHVAASLRGLHRMTLQQGCVSQGISTRDTLLAVVSTRKSE